MRDIFWVGVIYLASELLIWSLFLGLYEVRLDYLSPIIGMAVVFCFMFAISYPCPGSESFYHRHIKYKVCPSPLFSLNHCSQVLIWPGRLHQ